MRALSETRVSIWPGVRDLGTQEEIQCNLDKEEGSQSKMGLRIRPILLSRLSARRPCWV